MTSLSPKCQAQCQNDHLPKGRRDHAQLSLQHRKYMLLQDYLAQARLLLVSQEKKRVYCDKNPTKGAAPLSHPQHPNSTLLGQRSHNTLESFPPTPPTPPPSLRHTGFCSWLKLVGPRAV